MYRLVVTALVDQAVHLVFNNVENVLLHTPSVDYTLRQPCAFAGGVHVHVEISASRTRAAGYDEWISYCRGKIKGIWTHNKVNAEAWLLPQ